MNAPPQPWKPVSCSLVIVATSGPLTLQTHGLAPHPLWGKGTPAAAVIPKIFLVL